MNIGVGPSHSLNDYDNEFNLSVPQREFNSTLTGNAGTMKEDIIDGSPLASVIIQHIIESNNKFNNISFLGKFCSEGNNLGDSLDLVVLIVKLFDILDISKTKLGFPSSWNSLFGPPLDDNSIF